MNDALARLVRERAANRCEYCRLPQSGSAIPFEIDHVIARKHGGRTAAGNLALSCFYCNSFKGSNIAGLDPSTKKLSRLYHPRRHSWAWHFRWEGAILVGRTAIGRTTIAVLEINRPEAVALRDSLMAEGLFLISG